MRRKISLYIANQKVDLDDQSFILFNYAMEDLSNPTIVKNPFSQSITLKGTPNNNKIFGNIYRFDRETQYGDKSYGVHFDPKRKTPFVIYNELNEVLEDGYMKLNKVTRKGVGYEYHVTLFGGLGSFFYGLMFNEDGTKRTLFGLTYLWGDGSYSADFDYQRGFNHQRIKDGWDYLANPYNYDWGASDFKGWNIINFAPAYNGIPENFSADKAVVDRRFYNVPDGGTLDGQRYTYKSGTSSNLMVFTNPHEMWRMKDLRWYMMRPVIRLKSIIDAIANPINNGGYDIYLDQDVFGSQNELYENSWLTLPMVSPEDKGKTDLFNVLLNSTKSPGEYLISLAKIFGLVFMHERGTKKITIQTRGNFYKEHSSSVIDMTSRIKVDSVSIKPILGEQHYYQMGGNVVGEWAAKYKEDYGFDYGIQRINTGNEFNNETKIITEDVAYVDAVEIQERDLLFTSNYLSYDAASAETIESFVLPKYEGVSVQLWNGNDMQEFDVRANTIGDLYYVNPSNPLSDWLPKVQLHGEDQKPIDGTNVLLVFNGIKNAPQWTDSRRLEYSISDDTQDMMLLNDNVPCWNFTEQNVIKVNSLPSFRRCVTFQNASLEYLDSTWEWGSPRARGVNDVYEGTAPTIYNKWWKMYLSDRYDDDTFILSCKVDLRGLFVGRELMNRFFYYQGAIFVLNKIINHSLTTWDETECEFVKVQDKSNYLN